MDCFLRCSHVQYTQDTDDVALWLKETARSCGYVGDMLNVKEEAGSGGNARNRSNQRHYQDSTWATQSRPERKTYRIPIKAFDILAQFIAECKHLVIRANDGFLQTLDRAIALRKQHGEIMQGARLTASNHDHIYFIHVLETVKQIIDRPTPPEAHIMSIQLLFDDEQPSDDFFFPSADDFYTVTDNTTNVMTIYMNPDARQPSNGYFYFPPDSDDFSNVPDRATTPKTEPEPEPEPELELEPEFEVDIWEDTGEAYLAFFLLIQDFFEIRKAVADIWSKFAAGKYSSVAAALATNTAIDFARRLEQEFAGVEVIKRNGGIENAHRMWFAAMCDGRGPDPFYNEQLDDPFNFNFYDDAESVMLPAHVLLLSFLQCVQSETITVRKPDHVEPIDPTGTWDSKTPRQKFEHDKALLFQFLGPLTALLKVCSKESAIPAEDEVIRGLRIVIETREVSLWNVLSLQILLDIHHLMGQKVSASFEQLQGVAKHLRQSINTTLDMTSTSNPNRLQSRYDGSRRIDASIDALVMNDSLQDTLGEFVPLGPEQQFFFKNFPVFCGLYQYSLQMMYHDVSVSFVNTWHSVLNARHLYNALKQEKLLKSTWDDMELLALIQKDDITFAGKAPTTRKGFQKSFAFMNSTSPVSPSGSGRRVTDVENSQTPQRGFELQANLARVFMDRYCYDSGRVDFTEKNFEEILENVLTYDMDSPGAAAESDATTRPLRRDEWSSTRNPDNRESRANSRARAEALRSLTTPQLIERLADALATEAAGLELTFDYLRLHHCCWMLFKSLQVAVGEPMRYRFGPGFLKHEYQLPMIVGYLLQVLANPGTQGEQTTINPANGLVTSEFAALAAEALDEFLETDRLGSRVKDFLKNDYAMMYATER